MAVSPAQLAIAAYKATDEYQTKSYLASKISHGSTCVAGECTFWRWKQTSLYVCTHSSNIVHYCGNSGQCKHMIVADGGEGYVCPFTGIVSRDCVESVWGILHKSEAVMPSRAKCAQRHKVVTEADKIVTISSHVKNMVRTLLSDTPLRRKLTEHRRRNKLFSIAKQTKAEGMSLSEIAGKFYKNNRALTCSCVLTPARETWLVDVITNYIHRILGVVVYRTYKKIHAFTATCIINLGCGVNDVYNIVIFPRIPWLAEAVLPSEVGRLSDIRCGAQEKMWTAMCAHISNGRSVQARLLFLDKNSPPIPE